MKIITTIYKSSKLDGMFLYVEREKLYEKVPEQLLERFAEPQEIMTLVLQEGRKLAQANVEEVMSAITEQGYYLQITKDIDPEMRVIAEKNNKL